jgi:2',3'-cyclic-nucleotide 2'-phosphodiesterase (5'-nucleotidase family)
MSLKTNARLLIVIPLLLFVMLITDSCNKRTHVTAISPSTVEMNNSVAQNDSQIQSILKPYKLGMDSIMNVVIGTSVSAMPKEREKTETLLGNFVADIVLASGDKAYSVQYGGSADVCILNNGGLRSSLPQGNITRGNIFELMPFDNEIVVVTITGAKMWDLLKYVAASGGVPVAGMKMGIRADLTPGKVEIRGVAFDSTKTYRIVTSDYLANGGDKMSFLKDPVKLETTGVKIRDAIIAHFQALTQEKKSANPMLDGRVYYETK